MHNRADCSYVPSWFAERRADTIAAQLRAIRGTYPPVGPDDTGMLTFGDDAY